VIDLESAMSDPAQRGRLVLQGPARRMRDVGRVAWTGRFGSVRFVPTAAVDPVTYREARFTAVCHADAEQVDWLMRATASFEPRRCRLYRHGRSRFEFSAWLTLDVERRPDGRWRVEVELLSDGPVVTR
jgi:hypothetical protein